MSESHRCYRYTIPDLRRYGFRSLVFAAGSELLIILTSSWHAHEDLVDQRLFTAQWGSFIASQLLVPV